jgi:hypothetical protein
MENRQEIQVLEVYQKSTSLSSLTYSRKKSHKHHILPQHWFGEEDINTRDHPSNIIYLSYEAHIEAHRLLHEEYKLQEDEVAYKYMSGQSEEAFLA